MTDGPGLFALEAEGDTLDLGLEPALPPWSSTPPVPCGTCGQAGEEVTASPEVELSDLQAGILELARKRLALGWGTGAASSTWWVGLADLRILEVRGLQVLLGLQHEPAAWRQAPQLMAHVARLADSAAARRRPHATPSPLPTIERTQP